MPSVDVDGVGTLDLPDGMSQDEMTQAIESHPRVQQYKALYPSQNSFANAANVASAFGGEMIKSMPIIGAGLDPKINENPEQAKRTNMLTQFERDYPTGAAAASTLGDIGGTAATFAALPEMKVPPILDALGVSGKYLWDALQQGTRNSALTLGDTVAHKGKDIEANDAGNALRWGYGTGFLTPGLSKSISPRAITASEVPYHYLNKDLAPGDTPITRANIETLRNASPEDYQDLMDYAKGNRAQEIAKNKATPLSQDTIDKVGNLTKILGGATAAVGGHFAGGSTAMNVLEALGGWYGGKEIGQQVAPQIARVGHKWLNNQAMTKPGAEQLLKALSGATAVGGNRNLPIQ